VINTKDIIEIVSGIAEQILKIVYVCFSYIFIFSFLSFAVCLTFLQAFKEYKLKLLHILGWQKKKLLQALRFEYFYLLLIGSVGSILAGTGILLWIFAFIDYFPLHTLSYILWILLVWGGVAMMSLYLFVIKGK
jgi:predicted lysophospholipase L1 biosynthesis ABC-type transport system permease subunit